MRGVGEEEEEMRGKEQARNKDIWSHWAILGSAGGVGECGSWTEHTLPEGKLNER